VCGGGADDSDSSSGLGSSTSSDGTEGEEEAEEGRRLEHVFVQVMASWSSVCTLDGLYVLWTASHCM
jgi:hypothetical protein